MNNITSPPAIINIDSLPEVSAPTRRPRTDHLFQIMRNEKTTPTPKIVTKIVPVSSTSIQPSNASSSSNQIEIRDGQLYDSSGTRQMEHSPPGLLNFKIIQENQLIASMSKEEKARKLQESIISDVTALHQLKQQTELRNEARNASLTYSIIDKLNRDSALRARMTKPSPKRLMSFKVGNLSKKSKRPLYQTGNASAENRMLSKDPQWLSNALSSKNDSSSESSRGHSSNSSRPTSRQSSDFPANEDNGDIDQLLSWNSKKTIGRLPNTGLIFEKNEFNMNEVNFLAMKKFNAVCSEKLDSNRTEYLPRMKPVPLPCGHDHSKECIDAILNRLTNNGVSTEINGRLPHEYTSIEIKECISALIQNKNNICLDVSQNDVLQAIKQSQMELRIKESNQFHWARFIDYYNKKNENKQQPMKLAPAHLFVNKINKMPINTVEIGQKLEAIDPLNQNLFCICTVIEKCAMRLKLQFDGYPSMYDFWVNADSNTIFPPGFCDKTGRFLEPPGRTRTPIEWKEYLKRTNACPANRACFPHLENTVKKTNMNPFKKDMKFEAELNGGKLCVATVGDVMDTRVLVKFDNFEETFNFWADITSPYIHPVGFHKAYNFPIQTSPGNSHQSLNWNEYLKRTRSEAVPKSAFCMRQQYLFEPGMVLEVVDKKVPSLIRPAIVVDVKEYEIKILYIGWPERYAYWIKDDSTDIFPPEYCRKTNHPIECPLDEVYAGYGVTVKCVRGCRGIGNIKYPDQFGHEMLDECPYGVKSFRMDPLKVLPNRLERKPRINSAVNTDVRYVPRQKQQAMFQENTQLSLQPVLNPIELVGMAPKDVELYRRLQVSADFLKDNIQPLTEAHQKWMQNLEPSNAMKVSVAQENPLHWSVQKVAEFISDLPNCSDIGAVFVEHEIDGLAFLSLRKDDMINLMGLSLGAAIKIANRINYLREECNAKYIQYE